jgi:hypothetical protein
VLIAKEQSDYTPIPEGTHSAVSSAVVSLGIQESPYGKPKWQLLIRFEFPDFRVEREVDGQKVSEPMVKWQFYTNSLHKESNLRRDLEGWRGKGFTSEELKGFDVMNILGHACQVTIIHDHSGDRVKDKIRTVGKLMGEGEKPRPELKVIRYTDVENEQWELLPEFVQEKIRNQVKQDAPPPDAFQDDDIQDIDIPFSPEAA